jgi:HD superfamily phosphodiesterase
MSASRREIAEVTIPDTPLVAYSMEEARALSEPYLFNHAVRSWLFAVQLAEVQGVSYDEEVVAVASLLHDVGLTGKYQGKRRFEVEGADAARALAKGRRRGRPESSAYLVLRCAERDAVDQPLR